MIDPRPEAHGLDVVDATERRVPGKAGDRRFVERVFAPEEARRIGAAPDPDLELWIHWAAKEAVFKAETCARGRAPVFDHSTFVFTPDGASATGAGPAATWSSLRSASPGWTPRLFGEVHREGRRHPVAISFDGALVALAGPAGADRSFLLDAGMRVGVERMDAARSRLELPSELDAMRADPRYHPEVERAHSLHSAVVRWALRESLNATDPERGDHRIFTPDGPAGRVPPHVRIEGRADPHVDVSISHHGDLIAWAWRRR